MIINDIAKPTGKGILYLSEKAINLLFYVLMFLLFLIGKGLEMSVYVTLGALAAAATSGGDKKHNTNHIKNQKPKTKNRKKTHKKKTHKRKR